MPPNRTADEHVLRKRREARERGEAATRSLKFISIKVGKDRHALRRRARRKETLVGMIERGVLSPECQAAAEELQLVYLVRQDGQLRAVPLKEHVDGGRASDVHDVASINFAKWREHLNHGKYGFEEKGPRVYNTTLMVVVADASLREVEKKLCMKNGSANDLVRLGLQHYADICSGKLGRIARDPALRKSA